MAGFVFRREHGQSGSRDVGSRARIGKGKGMNAALDCQAHQVVPGGMELDFVTAMAVAVVSVEHWRMFVGEPAPFDGFGAAADAAEVFEILAGPAGAFARHRLPQGSIESERVVVYQRRRLILHFMIHVSYVINRCGGRNVDRRLFAGRRRQAAKGDRLPTFDYCAAFLRAGRALGLGLAEFMNNCSACCSDSERLMCVVAPLAVNVAASARVVTV